MESNQSTSYRAVLIGIDAYEMKPLNGCVNDIDRIEQILLDRLGVPPERITRFAAPLAGAQSSSRLDSLPPTRDGIREGLSRLAGEVGPEDLVFLYYSGHGSQVTTQLNGYKVTREALVPVDYWTGEREPRRLLYDFELNALLSRIAERARDLTVVLDCCHAASATREDIDRIGGDRYLQIPEVQDLSSLGPLAPSPRDSGGLLPATPTHLLVAACRACERSYETLPQNGSQEVNGAFTSALTQLLGEVDGPLSKLRWWDLWLALLDRIGRFNSLQHPLLVGRGERLVFGGPWIPRDQGYAIRQDGERFRIEAGTLTGLSEEAEVAVYGPEPPRFPDLDSPQDRAARIGLLRVERAERSSCTALSVKGALQIPAGARGRLVLAGKSDRLVVSLEPFDPELAVQMERWGMVAVPSGDPEAEVFLRRDGNRFHLGDEIYGDGRDPQRLPLASFDAIQLLVNRALFHMAWYRRPLRLPARCQDLPKALSVELLDCRSIGSSATEDLQAPIFPQLASDSPWNYKVREGDGFAVRINNRCGDLLHVSVLNCAGSGRVEHFGSIEVPPGSPQILWADSGMRFGQPFFPSTGTQKDSVVDRLIVVGTTLPDRDLDFLATGVSFEEALNGERDGLTRASTNPPVEQWTAELVTLRIYKDP
jgi:hypothetical protein